LILLLIFINIDFKNFGFFIQLGIISTPHHI
jgi:hypothetical protein